jgi:amphi-Trp domain-containing protein
MSTKNKERVEFSSTVTSEVASQHLEALATGLREHVMLIETGGQSLALDVSRDVRIELEAAADSKKSTIDVKITWTAEEGAEITRPTLRVVPASVNGERYDATLLADDDTEHAVGPVSDNDVAAPTNGAAPRPVAPTRGAKPAASGASGRRAAKPARKNARRPASRPSARKGGRPGTRRR